MKRILVIAAFGIASLFNSGSSSAQKLAARATVPFSFNVGDKLLPASTYTITSTLHGRVTIQSADKRSVATATVFQADGQLAADGNLVFFKVGDRYFLHQVRCQSALIDADLLTSNLEKKTRRQQSNPSIGETAGEMTLVAAR